MPQNIIKLIIFAFIVFIGIVPFVIVKPVYIYPSPNTRGASNSDSIFNGNSISEVYEISPKRVVYKSHLKYGYPYPFAGYTFSFNANKSFKFRNKITYDIRATKSEFLRFNIGIKVKEMDNFIYESEFKVEEEKGSLLLSEFEPAMWWYYDHGLEISDLSPPKLENIVLFSVVNSGSSPIDISEDVTINEIKAVLDPFPFIIISSSLLFGFILLELILYKRKSTGSNVKYRVVEIDKEENHEANLVVDFIGENYNLIDISVDMISIKTGISKYKIPEILKEKFHSTFPQYLNKIRILEVKRLLIETDLSVLDISLSVGYNTVSHFNRTFKKIEGITPLNYRKEHKKQK